MARHESVALNIGALVRWGGVICMVVGKEGLNARIQWWNGEGFYDVWVPQDFLSYNVITE